MPGEGNRKHYHSDWDEWWYIIKGEWEWNIEGTPKIVKKGDLVFIERNRVHKITATGNKMAIRLAVSREDVDHIYQEEDFKLLFLNMPSKTVFDIKIDLDNSHGSYVYDKKTGQKFLDFFRCFLHYLLDITTKYLMRIIMVK